MIWNLSKKLQGAEFDLSIKVRFATTIPFLKDVMTENESSGIGEGPE